MSLPAAISNRRVAGACAALACASGLAVAAVDAASARPRAVVAAAAKITPAGVDGVKLGETYAQLRAGHLVGRIGKGCELAGPNARSASLRAPLQGRAAAGEVRHICPGGLSLRAAHGRLELLRAVEPQLGHEVEGGRRAIRGSQDLAGFEAPEVRDLLDQWNVCVRVVPIERGGVL